MNGVTFGSKHSYRDWGLILKSRPVISPPSPKTVYVDIPASNGIIDLTESLTGDVKFANRTITCEFNVIDVRKKWSNIYSDVLDFLHGQMTTIILDEDPDYIYKGRVQVNEWKSNKRTATIVIEGNVEPYKLEKFGSLENWEWDSFNFETGIIREYKDIVVEERLTLEIQGTRKTVVPTIIVTSSDGSGMNVRFNNKYYHLDDGKNMIPYISIVVGNNTLVFEGNGTVSVDYRGGRL